MQTEEQKQREQRSKEEMYRALNIRGVNFAIIEERWSDVTKYLDILDFPGTDLSLKDRIALFKLIGMRNNFLDGHLRFLADQTDEKQL